MPRGQFDALRLDLRDGERVHVYGRPELFEPRGELRLRALSIERFGLGEHLAALERLKQKLAAEGLFAAERKRPLPRIPRRIGLVTGNDAAAKRDVIGEPCSALSTGADPRRRDPRPGPSRGGRHRRALGRSAPSRRSTSSCSRAAAGASRTSCRSATSASSAPSSAVRCPSSARSATSRTRRSATSPPTSGPRRRPPPARLVVPDLAELVAPLERARAALGAGRAAVGRAGPRAARRGGASLRRAPPALSLERRRAAARALGREAPRALAARDARARLRDRPQRGRRRPRGAALGGRRQVDVALAEGGFAAQGRGDACVREDAFEEAEKELERSSSGSSGHVGARRRGRALGAGEELYQLCVERLDAARARSRSSRGGSRAPGAGAPPAFRIPRDGTRPRSPEEGPPLREPRRQGGREARAARSRSATTRRATRSPRRASTASASS